MFIYTIRDIVGLSILLLVIVAYLLLFVRAGIYNFLRWRKSGYCRHDFKLFSTFGSGSNADYRCTKCGERRVMNLNRH